MRPPPRPISTFARIDAETHHILPEESWFGAEFDSRAAPGEQHYSGADTHHTNAFTVWGPGTLVLADESRPYATNASRLDNNIAMEEERQARAIRKYDQLVRHGLVVGDHDRLRPLLALPSVSDREQGRRKQTAQRLVDQYIYESSEDDAIASRLIGDSRKKPKKGRLVKLKEALAKLEIPSERSQAGQQLPLTTLSVEDGIFDKDAVIYTEDGSLPTLGFQKAMRNPSHPDFGMDFTAALRLAMAKEKKAHTLAMSDDSRDADEGDSDIVGSCSNKKEYRRPIGESYSSTSGKT